MEAQNFQFRRRVEEYLPLRGKWLHYFLVLGRLLLLTVWWAVGGHDNWRSLSTLVSSDPQHLACRVTPSWGLYCGSYRFPSGHFFMKLWIGPWVFSWLTDGTINRAVWAVLNLVSAMTAVSILFKLRLQAIYRNNSGKPGRCGPWSL